MLLPIQRKHAYYRYKVGLPMFLTVLSVCSCFLIEFADLASRIGVITTVLLAVAAFQYVVNDEVPHLSFMTNIDSVIIAGYVIVCIVLLESCALVGASFLTNIDKSGGLVDVVVGTTTAGVWCIMNCIFWLIPSKHRQSWFQTQKEALERVSKPLLAPEIEKEHPAN
eukprot:m.27215 g.27215  ORF g.27215 m.27215 type:complete len:167 (-) comp8910_c0_seq1:643-1143(-)